jgi:hypothetical protein
MINKIEANFKTIKEAEIFLAELADGLNGTDCYLLYFDDSLVLKVGDGAKNISYIDFKNSNKLKHINKFLKVFVNRNLVHINKNILSKELNSKPKEMEVKKKKIKI